MNLRIRLISAIIIFTLTLIIIASLRGTGAEPRYHPYPEVVQDMESVAENNTDIVRLHNLSALYGAPLTHENRSLLALEITDRDGNRGEPEVLIMGCHHAREWISVEVPLYFVHYLVDNYGTDPYVTYLVDNRDIWIIPVVNPDGYVKSWEQNDRGHNWTGWRKNCRDNNGDGVIDGNDGVDLNRNYGYRWGYDNMGSSPDPSSNVYRGIAPFSEPETQAIRALALNHTFSMVLTYHSYMDAILYPWAYAKLDTPDNEVFVEQARQMAVYNDYTYGNTKSGVVYPCNGEATDWFYGRTGALAYTIELGGNSDKFIPDESRIIPICKDNLQVNLYACDVADSPRNISEFLDAGESDTSKWNYSGTGRLEISEEGVVGGHSFYMEVGNDPVTDLTLSLNISLVREEGRTFASVWEKYDLSRGSTFGLYLKTTNGHLTRVPPYPAGKENVRRGPGMVSDWREVYYELTPYLTDDPQSLQFILNSTAEKKGDYIYIDAVTVSSASPYEVRERESRDAEPYSFSIDPEHYNLTILPGESRTLPVNITNQAMENNTINLTAISRRTGWDITLTHNGAEVGNITLSPSGTENDTATFNITLSLPTGLYVGEKGNFTVGFVSQENSSQNRTLPINVTVGGICRLSADSMADVHFIPGNRRMLALNVHNQGNSEVSVGVDYSVKSGDAGDWSVSLPASQNVGAYADSIFYLNITAPGRIAAGTVLELNLKAMIEGHSSGNGTAIVPLRCVIDRYIDAGVVPLSPLTVVPGEENQLKFRLENHGNVGENFTLSASSIWEVSLPSTPFTIDAYGSAIFYLLVMPPAETAPDQLASVTISISTAEGELNTTAFTLTSTRSYGIFLSSSSGDITIPGGLYRTVSLTVKNNGNAVNNITLSVDRPSGFLTELSKNSLQIQPFSQSIVTLTITAPDNAPAGSIYYITLSASSENDPEQTAAFTLNVSVGKSYGVKLTLDVEERRMTVSPGEEATFVITLTNSGNGREIITLTLSGVPEGWEAVLDDTNISLERGKSRFVRLTVTPPKNAKGNDIAKITLTARCGDSYFGYVSDDIQVTTIVEDGGGGGGISSTALYLTAGVLGLALLLILGFIFLRQREAGALEKETTYPPMEPGDEGAAEKLKEEAPMETPAPIKEEEETKEREETPVTGPATQVVECPQCKAEFEVELPESDKRTVKTLCPECGAIFSFERKDMTSEEREEEKEKAGEGLEKKEAEEKAGAEEEERERAELEKERPHPKTQVVVCPQCKAEFEVELPKLHKRTVKTLCPECGAIFSFERKDMRGKEREKREERMGETKEPAGRREEKETGEKAAERHDISGLKHPGPVKNRPTTVVKEKPTPLTLHIDSSSGVSMPEVMRCPRCGHKVFLMGNEKQVKCIFCGSLIVIKRDKGKKETSGKKETGEKEETLSKLKAEKKEETERKEENAGEKRENSGKVELEIKEKIVNAEGNEKTGEAGGEEQTPAKKEESDGKEKEFGG